ncbi:hypothetical protein Tco_1007473, partial [Tanacetum coccineum]
EQQYTSYHREPDKLEFVRFQHSATSLPVHESARIALADSNFASLALEIIVFL